MIFSLRVKRSEGILTSSQLAYSDRWLDNKMDIFKIENPTPRGETRRFFSFSLQSYDSIFPCHCSCVWRKRKSRRRRRRRGRSSFARSFVRCRRELGYEIGVLTETVRRRPTICLSTTALTVGTTFEIVLVFCCCCQPQEVQSTSSRSSYYGPSLPGCCL